MCSCPLGGGGWRIVTRACWGLVSEGDGGVMLLVGVGLMG